jgi:hypothetical protein
VRTVFVVLERPPGAVRDYVLYGIGPFNGSGPAHDYRRERGLTNFEVVEFRSPEEDRRAWHERRTKAPS